MASPKRTVAKTRQIISKLNYTHYIFSLFLIVLGAVFLIVGVVNSQPQPKRPVFQPQIIAKPAKIYIPKLNKVLAVSDGYFNNNRWEVSQTGVSFYTESVFPGTVGNSVFYGHNRKDILGGLSSLSSGDLIYIIADNGQFFKYEVSQTLEIAPNQVEILNPTSDKRLTIYTCSGFLDQSRFTAIAHQIDKL